MREKPEGSKEVTFLRKQQVTFLKRSIQTYIYRHTYIHM